MLFHLIFKGVVIITNRLQKRLLIIKVTFLQKWYVIYHFHFKSQIKHQKLHYEQLILSKKFFFIVYLCYYTLLLNEWYELHFYLLFCSRDNRECCFLQATVFFNSTLIKTFNGNVHSLKNRTLSC